MLSYSRKGEERVDRAKEKARGIQKELDDIGAALIIHLGNNGHEFNVVFFVSQATAAAFLPSFISTSLLYFLCQSMGTQLEAEKPGNSRVEHQPFVVGVVHTATRTLPCNNE